MQTFWNTIMMQNHLDTQNNDHKCFDFFWGVMRGGGYHIHIYIYINMFVYTVIHMHV